MQIEDSTIEIKQGNKKVPLHPMKPFDEIITGPTSCHILQVVDDLNFIQPTQIQCQVIPTLCNSDEKLDLMVQAPLGSGKTISFMISMLLHVNFEQNNLQAICVCQNNDIAIQKFNIFEQMNKYTRFKVAICPSNTQENENPPDKDVQVIFGTPNSINYSIKKGFLDVSNVNLVVIEDAEELINKKSKMHDATIQLLQKNLPQNAQFAFFSTQFASANIDWINKSRPNAILIRQKQH